MDKNDPGFRDFLKSVLDYCPATGVFTWKTQRTWRRNAGEEAGGTLDGKGYPRLGIAGKRYTAHRLAWFYVHGVWPSDDIDHINGDRTDNRLCNLRPATRSENNFNKGSSAKSGFKGVTKSPLCQSWRAEIKVGGVRRYLGSFRTPEAAHAAYCKAAGKIAGRFARTA